MPVNLENLPSIRDFLSSENEYLDLLTNPETWDKIPLLKHSKLPENGSLVRFRGMIQDMLDPEFFLEEYEVKTKDGQRIQDGRFVDFLQYNQDDEEVDVTCASNKHGERRSLFLVTIPGINDWADETIQESTNLPEVEKLSFNPGKRPEDQENSILKRQKVEKDSPAIQPMSTHLSCEYLINSPLPDRPSQACLVKIYKDFEKFHLNRILDVVGFLSVDPGLDGSTEEVEDLMNHEEHIVRNPPPSLIPRLHAISTREVPQVNPFVREIEGEDFQDISRDILMMLTQCLFGDELAGRYLLAHLISSIQSRVGMEILGKMCLNLTNIPGISSGYSKSLYGILEAILPVSYRLEMTLENLNDRQFTPKKDYKTGKLTSGILQLAPGTNLVIDETCLESGQLQSGGIEAVKSIGHLIRNQSVEADFQFYRLEYESDVAVLILSEGKSLLPSDIMLPLKPDSKTQEHIDETFKAAHQFIRTRSKVIRGFLSVQKAAQFELDENMQSTVQEDLVVLRKAFNATPEELHNLLTVSRLLGKSLGKKKLDAEIWQLAKKMDEERRERIRK